jgi:hypothetical protein
MSCSSRVSSRVVPKLLKISRSIVCRLPFSSSAAVCTTQLNLLTHFNTIIHNTNTRRHSNASHVIQLESTTGTGEYVPNTKTNAQWHATIERPCDLPVGLQRRRPSSLNTTLIHHLRSPLSVSTCVCALSLRSQGRWGAHTSAVQTSEDRRLTHTSDQSSGTRHKLS